MTKPITAAMLYDLVSCPHRVALDAFGDPAERDAPNPFIQLLWERGTFYEREVMEGLEVPFYKRAQLTAADLAVAFAGRGYGDFTDLRELTSFADNLVPHVLRRSGALIYAPDLAKRIDAEERIDSGSAEEVEIRAAAVHAVELCVESLHKAGVSMTAHRLDYILWSRGQTPAIKAHPRHRTRSVYY